MLASLNPKTETLKPKSQPQVGSPDPIEKSKP